MLLQAIPTTPFEPTPDALKPARVNCAGRCRWCSERSCNDPRCISLHQRSRWMVCPDCDGLETRGECQPCGCLEGVIEAGPCEPPALTVVGNLLSEAV